MKRLNQILDTLLSSLALVSFSMLALIVGWQVFARYVLNNSPSWSEPLAMLLLLYAVMLGTAVGVRNNDHLGLTWFRSQFSNLTQTRLTCLESILITGFGCAMFGFGTQMAMQTWQYQIPGLAISMGVQYLVLVFSGFSIALFSLEKLIYREPR